VIAAVVLAAGRSERFGEPKQLVRLGGASLVRRAVGAAVDGGCIPVIAVLGSAAERVGRELVGSPARSVINDDWKAGLASSVRAGVAALDGESAVRAVLLLTCDQPLLDGAIVREILEAFDGAAGRIVACEYAGTVGVPALFERSRFPELADLSGERGASRILREHAADVVRVPWPGGAIDIDTPEDYERFRRGPAGCDRIRAGERES